MSENNVATETTQEAGSSPESGEKLFAGKYSTIEQLEKGYAETTKEAQDLRTSLNKLKVVVPESYEFDLKSVEELKGYSIDLENDPDIQAILPSFKEAGLTNDQAQKILSGYLRNFYQNVPSAEDEMKKLGEEGQKAVAALEKYSSNMSDEDKKVFSALATSADNVRFLHKHLVSTEKSIPANSSAPLGKSPQELRDEAFSYREKHSATIASNPDQLAHYNKLMQESFKDG